MDPWKNDNKNPEQSNARFADIPTASEFIHPGFRKTKEVGGFGACQQNILHLDRVEREKEPHGYDHRRALK